MSFLVCWVTPLKLHILRDGCATMKCTDCKEGATSKAQQAFERFFVVSLKNNETVTKDSKTLDMFLNYLHLFVDPCAACC